MVAVTVGLSILLGWTQQDQRRSIKIRGWIAAILICLVVRWFAPFDVGPTSWGGVYDWIMPDGYAEHSVETAISVDEHWIVGETKTCKSFPLDFRIAPQLGKEPGDAVGSFHCDGGPMHTVTVKVYGRINQPEHATAYWRCIRDPEVFTCRQTGAE